MKHPKKLMMILVLSSFLTESKAQLQNLYWKSAGGTLKPMVFFSNWRKTLSGAIYSNGDTLTGGGGSYGSSSSNELNTHAFFVSNGWGTSGMIGWYVINSQSKDDINTFYQNKKESEKAFYKDMYYLEFTNIGQDENGFYDTYKVKNRGRYVGYLFIGNNYMQFERTGKPIVTYTGNFIKLR